MSNRRDIMEALANSWRSATGEKTNAGEKEKSSEEKAEENQ
ncbi:MAG: hypothetical protein U5L01_04865 [Rheinheimera sp.]|nr:hypothetical protein [Rheinheimera sp.]